ncbi:MAG: GNAT family N-acetyltransferase [Bacteroidia bacterium]|nr:GNAT family N-acetyltransferase [Bacteroidia bacterium]
MIEKSFLIVVVGHLDGYLNACFFLVTDIYEKLPSLSIHHAHGPKAIEEVRDLLQKYAELRSHDVALGDYERELRQLPGAYAAPTGFLLLARWDDSPVGCVAIRDLGEGFCEMKRMFVLPEHQGKGIGSTLASEIIYAAKGAGYQHIRLDTHPWMAAAIKMYQALGFIEIGRYNENPTPGIRFFEKKL